MEPVAPRTLLYDFLYRDPVRVASYYAQLFGGHLMAQENTSQKRTTTDKSGGLMAGIAKGDYRSSQEGTDGTKDTIAPHDTIVCDLLVRMAEQGRVGEAATARPGSIVRATGTLSLVDGSGIRAAMAGVTAMLSAQQPRVNREHRRAKGNNNPPPNESDIAPGIAGLSQLTFPSLFLLQSSELMYYGTVKDVGLDEPVIAFLFKHGEQGLPGVTVLGVKEGSEPFPSFSDESLLGPSRSIMGTVSRMMIPPDGTAITPLVIYRTTGMFSPDTRE